MTPQGSKRESIFITAHISFSFVFSSCESMVCVFSKTTHNSTCTAKARRIKRKRENTISNENSHLWNHLRGHNAQSFFRAALPYNLPPLGSKEKQEKKNNAQCFFRQSAVKHIHTFHSRAGLCRDIPERKARGRRQQRKARDKVLKERERARACAMDVGPAGSGPGRVRSGWVAPPTCERFSSAFCSQPSSSSSWSAKPSRLSEASGSAALASSLASCRGGGTPL